MSLLLLLFSTLSSPGLFSSPHSTNMTNNVDVKYALIVFGYWVYSSLDCLPELHRFSFLLWDFTGVCLKLHKRQVISTLIQVPVCQPWRPTYYFCSATIIP